MSTRRTLPGFTLIELMVGLAIGAVLATAATSVLLVARTSATEAAFRARMSRDAQLVMDNIERDLSYFGAGVPLLNNLDPGTSATNDTLRPILRRGAARNLVFIGDLPYPNAELPGIASITRVRDQNSLTGAGRIAFTNELTGPCTAPRTTAPVSFQCQTTTTTLIPGAYVAADDCNDSQATARTCPWGMNKWQPGTSGMFLTFVTTNGNWLERRVDAAGFGQTFNEYVGLDLENDFPTVGGGKVRASDYFNPTGSGYVTVLDRVFYAIEDPATPDAPCATTNCAVYRRQCWGRIEDPEHADFPAVRPEPKVDHIGRPAQAILNCAAPDYGTDWEMLASGLDQFTFTYLRPGGTTITPNTNANRSLVRAIQIDLRFRRTIPGTSRTVLYPSRRVFFLNNRE